jgi:hypothetical protein
MENVLQTSPLLNALLNRAAAAAPRQVELTPGQVVKGAVLKLYPDNMALVQIGGMQVHARLEANLEAGQKAWLQVQPSNGVVTLKVLQNTTHPQEPLEASWQALLRLLGLNDTPDNTAIVKALVSQNMPVSKEVLQALSHIVKNVGADQATIDACMLAMRRGLPLSEEVVGAIKTFLSGQPLTDAIDTFVKEAEHFLAQTDQEAADGKQPKQEHLTSVSSTLRETVLTLKGKVSQLPVSVALDQSIEQEYEQHGGLRPKPDAGQTEPDKLTPAARQHANRSDVPITGKPAPTAGMPPAAGEEATGVVKSGANPELPAASSQEHATVSPKGQGIPAAYRGVDNQPAAHAPAPVLLPEETDAVESRNMPTLLDNDVPPKQGERDAQTIVRRQVAPEGYERIAAQPHDRFHPPSSSALQESGSKGELIKELFLRLGVSHEHDLIAQGVGAKGLDAKGSAHLDSVKSLLMQIIQEPAGAVPSGLREAAETLLKQVTGQQLMMVQPHVQTLSQIVMQIPFRMESADETAYVQIEAKKGEGGQLDPDNCRLFFNLELERLGTTFIDVGIVNRIINLQIYNDQPWVEDFVHQMKDHFAAQLRQSGYHLSGLRVQSLPDLRSTSTVRTAKEGMLAAYKGVDIRI